MSIGDVIAKYDLSEAESNSILEICKRGVANIATRRQRQKDLEEFGDNILRIRKKNESTNPGHDSEINSDESSPNPH